MRLHSYSGHLPESVQQWTCSGVLCFWRRLEGGLNTGVLSLICLIVALVMFALAAFFGYRYTDRSRGWALAVGLFFYASPMVAWAKSSLDILTGT